MSFLLRSGEQALAENLATIDDAVVVTRADLDRPGPTIVAVSRGFCALTGYAADELTGRSPRLLQGPLTERGVLDRLRAACERRERFVGETVNYRKDGSTYIVEWVIEPLHNEKGCVSHFLAVQHDVTARRRFARQWIDADAQVRQLLEQLGDHTAAVAEAILVLEQTKRSFRSTQLGELRRRLEKLRQQSAPPGCKPPAHG